MLYTSCCVHVSGMSQLLTFEIIACFYNMYNVPDICNAAFEEHSDAVGCF